MQKLPLCHFLFTGKDALCITLTQDSSDKTVTSGSQVTLFCTYDVNFYNLDLFWYRKRQDLSFQFILYRDDTRSHDAEFVQGRFSVKHSKVYRTFHLVINPVWLEDSGTYYCALGATVMQVPRKPVPKPLAPSLGAAPFYRKSHGRLSGVLLSHLYSSPQMTTNKKPGHSQGRLWLPRSRASHFGFPGSLPPESPVIGYGEL
ncbi:T cell receptor delta variable 5 [Cricetulus griseus]